MTVEVVEVAVVIVCGTLIGLLMRYIRRLDERGYR